jgi:5-(carboxyamino)imidazole ribonucleotide mutase
MRTGELSQMHDARHNFRGHPKRPTGAIATRTAQQSTRKHCRLRLEFDLLPVDDPGREAGAMAQRNGAPQVGVVMGSDSDWDVMQHAARELDAFGVGYEARVLSAHRMPDEMYEYAEDAESRGLRAIIAGAGGAAHLPGMLASKTLVPVLGVPVPSRYLRGEDSLWSIVQMPRGVPVATFAIGEAGAANAALFAIAMLAAIEPALARKLATFRTNQTAAARAMRVPPGAGDKPRG